MNNPEADGRATANQPPDETDFAILGRVRQLFEETDPMPADLPGRSPGPLGDGIDRFERTRQFACQGSLLRREDFLQDADLHPRFSPRKPIGKPVQGLG